MVFHWADFDDRKTDRLKPCRFQAFHKPVRLLAGARDQDPFHCATLTARISLAPCAMACRASSFPRSWASVPARLTLMAFFPSSEITRPVRAMVPSSTLAYAATG